VFAVVMLDQGAPTGVLLDAYTTAGAADTWASERLAEYRVVPAVHLTCSARARAGSLAGPPRVPMLAPSTVSGAGVRHPAEGVPLPVEPASSGDVSPMAPRAVEQLGLRPGEPSPKNAACPGAASRP
jgi:hypothetical protein